MDALGVRMDSVPVGRSEWPLFSGGVAPAQAKEETAAAAAVTATFTFANLTPKRLTGRYEFTHEVAASTPDLEAALRRDLGDAVTSSMQQTIINGTAPNTQNLQRIEGLIPELGAAVDLSTAEAVAGDYGRLHSLAVDGIHASMETEVMSVVGGRNLPARGGRLHHRQRRGRERIAHAALRRLLCKYIHSRQGEHEAKRNPSCRRAERRRRHAGRFRGGCLADLGSDSRYLQPSQPGRCVDVGGSLGCQGGAASRCLRAHCDKHRLNRDRVYCEIRQNGRRLSGTAVRYGDVATLPWGRERFTAGAFAPIGDVLLNSQHDRRTPLARTGGGGLEIRDTAEALLIEAELPATGAADT